MTTRNIILGQVAVLAVVVAGVFGFYQFNDYIYQKKQSDDTVERYHAELEGAFVCLESIHEACVPGITTDTGAQYGIDFNALSTEAPKIGLGQRIRVSGMMVPVELLSAAFWHDIGVQGVLLVGSVTEL